MIVSFRPHKISYKIISEQGYYNDEGVWIVGQDQWSELCPCRYEGNGKANSIVLQDGNSYIYSYVVFLNLDTRDFQIGEQVKLYDLNDKELSVYTVKGFHRGQLNCKLWL